jgi:transposase
MANEAALIDQAADLYVREGLTLDQVAEQVGVPVGTIRRWSAQYDWKKRQGSYRQQSRDVDAYVEKIKLRLAEQLMETEPDPQLIYALTKGLAVLKPSAAVELKKIEKAEEESKDLSPEEKRDKVREAIEGIYGIRV